MKFKFLRNNRGQVAIFIALMFQVLFLFFAMIVNVGLLVHHKINLQNSVDIAAYYGASKQAEVLNAISHVNYQIRQSWKLLVWRQKVLGTAGIDQANAGFPYGKLLSGQPTGERIAGFSNSTGSNLFELPTFCITYAPHEIGGMSNTNENSCRRMNEAQVVPLPSATILSLPPFISFGFTVAAAITQAANSAFDRCADMGAMNFLMGGKFISAHYLDSDERAFLINYLATGLSGEENNFYELSGDDVKKGLEKTLKKNLTSANSSTVEYEIYNSLGASSCKNATTEGNNVPQWLSPVEIYPIWRYLDCTNNNTPPTGGVISTVSKQLVNNPSTLPSQLNRAKLPLREGVQRIATNLSMRSTLIGFEKDPWCVPYVGVKAKAKPKIPFMPLSEVEITAEAFAKPFGGRIGPWYVKDWPQSVSSSSRTAYKANAQQPSDQMDPIGGVRVSSLSNLTNIDDKAWAPNIARFFGDTFGFSSERVLAYFHRALLDSTKYTGLAPSPNYPFPLLPAAQDTGISLRYYHDISSNYTTGNDNPNFDQMTWDRDANMAPRQRLLEIAAIAPTIYDLANYSIDPDFYNNYFVPIQNGLTKRPGWKSEHVLLGDYGWRAKDEKAKKMNIMDQIKIQRDVAKVLESDTTMPYVVKNSEHLLNSWSVDNLLDYRANSLKFGKCFSPDESTFETPMNPPTPGNCVDGGRVGNSVKLVSKQWLKATDLELGGNSLTGPIRNPPPW